MPKYWI